MTIPEARAFVGQGLGLSGFDGSISSYASLNVDDQLAVTRGAINYIIANPGRFTPQQVFTAQSQAGQAATLNLDDTGFDWSLFRDEVLSNAGNVVKAAGFTISTALILAAIAFAAVYAYRSAPSTSVPVVS